MGYKYHLKSEKGENVELVQDQSGVLRFIMIYSGTSL